MIKKWTPLDEKIKGSNLKNNLQKRKNQSNLRKNTTNVNKNDSLNTITSTINMPTPHKNKS